MKKLIIASFCSLLLVISACSSNHIKSSVGVPQTVKPTKQLPKQTLKQSSKKQAAKLFSVSDLKKYDGKNGTPAYIAVNGIVYDVTHASNWRNGTHCDTSAGKDLTNVISSSPHGNSVLKSLPIVGKLKK